MCVREGAFRSSASVARSRAVARCRGARVFVRVIWREPIHVGGKPARALRPGHDRRRRDPLPKECANRRVDDPAGRGTTRRVACEGRGETHLAERGGDTERRRGFQRALNHEHRVCASRATRSVSPPTEERRFFAKLLQHIALFASAPKEKIAKKNHSISVFSVFFCLKRVQCSAEVDDCSTARKLWNNPIAAMLWRSQ